MDWHEERSDTLHGSIVEQVIAALSADPITIDELSEALVRFLPPSTNDPQETREQSPEDTQLADSIITAALRQSNATGTFDSRAPDLQKSPLRNWLKSGLNDEPDDAGLVLIELAAKLIVVKSTYSSYAHRGSVQVRSPDGQKSWQFSYHLDRSWRFLYHADHWQYQAQQRRSEHPKNEIDSRSVLYGEPLLEFIVRSCLDNWHRRDRKVAESPPRWTKQSSSEPQIPSTEEPNDHSIREMHDDLFRDFHAAWLLTPLMELNGKCPREILVEQREHISVDLDDR